MNNKLTSAVKWGKFNSIFGIVMSILSILSCVGLVVGILMLIAYLKLNAATDSLKELSTKAANSSEEYETVVEKYGEYLKYLGITNIIVLVLMIVGIIFSIIFYSVLFATVGSMSSGGY